MVEMPPTPTEPPAVPDEPRTPDPSPTESDSDFAETLVGYNLRRAYAALLQHFNAYFSPFDIRPVQFTLLGHLYNNPDASQSQVGKVLDVQRANLVTLLDELEQRGLLRREPSRDDKRSRVLNLTAEGKQLTEQLLEINEKSVRDIDQVIDKEDRMRLIELLQAVRQLRSGPR